MRIAVTGGSGKAGRGVVRDLLEHGHDVRNVDLRPSAESFSPDTPVPFLPADLTDLGETLEALDGVDAIVHLAAIPSPGHGTPDVVFRTNVTSCHTVFSVARRLGVEKVVWASSETTLGLPFDESPRYAPVDEEHVRPESSYALSKVVGEELARTFSRWSGIPILGLRLSNVLVRDDYAKLLPPAWDDPHARKWNLWGYVDESHVNEAVRCALAADVRGAEAFVIAAADTVMRRPSRDLMAEVFPDVPLRGDLGEHETLLRIDKARRVLGYDPTWSWRELV
jgi:nucleoside-diphosphate-sugar epimerase